MDPKTMWGAGDYAAVADRIVAVGEHAVEAAGVEPGLDVLDVACGAGNATIPAALTGARVTGFDLSPVLLEIARGRAAEAGLEVTWVEGDAQRLPFGDHGFDRVISVFGHMFVPDHERMAAELLRVCRPGGGGDRGLAGTARSRIARSAAVGPTSRWSTTPTSCWTASDRS